MLMRYAQICEHLASLNSDEIDALRLSSLENRKVDSLLQQLTSLHSVTKALQFGNTSVSDTRALFDAVI